MAFISFFHFMLHFHFRVEMHLLQSRITISIKKKKTQNVGDPSYQEAIDCKIICFSISTFAQRLTHSNSFDCSKKTKTIYKIYTYSNVNVMYRFILVSFALISAASAIFLSGELFLRFRKRISEKILQFTKK